MPSKSRRQQRFFFAVKGAKHDPDAPAHLRKVADSMSEKDIDDFTKGISELKTKKAILSVLKDIRDPMLNEDDTGKGSINPVANTFHVKEDWATYIKPYVGQPLSPKDLEALGNFKQQGGTPPTTTARTEVWYNTTDSMGISHTTVIRKMKDSGQFSFIAFQKQERPTPDEDKEKEDDTGMNAGGPEDLGGLGGPPEGPNPSLKGIKEAAEEEEEGKEMDEQFQQEEEQVAEAGLTSEDLDEIIKELENEVADEEEGQPVAAAPAPVAGDEEGGEELPPAPAPAVGGDIEGGPEAGADINAEPGSEIDINLGPEAGAEGGEEAGVVPPPAGMNAGGVEGQPPVGVPPAAPAGIPGEDEDENINLEELLAALNEESEEEEEESVDESLQNHGVPKNDQQSKATVKGYPKTGPEKVSPGSHQVTGKNHNISGKGNIGTGAVGGLSETAQYKTALKEAYKTIEFLRGQINEVNLLNAKLLYTNKLFKEFAGVLDDPYRMKIVESFDLTKSVREVKLAYALLAESLNFGTHMAKVPAKQIVKTAVAKGQVKQITEGFASKPVSSTRPSQLITEGNEMALRFKKLAGIKEAPKVSSEKK